MVNNKNSKDNNLAFSVVMAIYNTEKYLQEAIDSVINQTLDFKKHIKLILVNDGSTDSCEEICLKYKNRYPDNIEYIYKENGGVSSARNLGMEYVDTKYVNFFDSDDIWRKDSFKAFYDFLRLHDEEVDMVSSRVTIFGDMDADHKLNYKYEEDAVIDLDEHPDYIQAAIGNCVFVSEAIKDTRFDTQLKTSEDTLFLNTILLKKCKCGVVEKGEYMYRRRSNSASVLKSRYNRFVIEPELFQKRLYEISIEMTGKLQPFITFLVMYEMQWRIMEQPTPDITEEQIAKYEETIHSLLQEINDKFIYRQKSLSIPLRCIVYRLKYGDDFYKSAKWKKGRAFYKGSTVCNLLGDFRCRFFVTETDGDTLILKGSEDFSMLNVEYSLYAKDNDGEIYFPETAPYPKKDYVIFNKKTMVYGKRITFRLPLKDGKRYSFYVSIEDKTVIRLNPSFIRDAKLFHLIKHSYWHTQNHIIKFLDNRLCVFKYHKKTHIVSEIRLIRDILAEPEASDKVMALYRIAYYLLKLFHRKEIWLFNDRDYHATDNGSSVFKYACQHTDNKAKYIFTLKKESANYKELKKYGKVIEPYTMKHRMMFLLASKIVSSEGDVFVRNTFPGNANLISDLINSKFIYLQHGIMQGDLSSWLNVLDRNIKLLVAGSKMEVENILKCDFGYTSKEVKLLGVPRFDALNDRTKEKRILFLPTWRNYLVGKREAYGNERGYIEDFKNTDYCQFYNGLINDKRLIDAMKEHGYHGDFYLHPVYRKQKDDFQGNEVIDVHDNTPEYQTEMSRASMMITDYSGVQFDFAYQRRPIAYSQYDNIYANMEHHIYNKSFFKYESMGFGPITRTIDTTVDYIIERMKNNCDMEEEYLRRVDEFFAFKDSRNSERVYEELKKMD